MTDLHPGAKQRYMLQQPLGQGGMGIIYRALDRLTGQTVALKRVATPTVQYSSNTQTLSISMLSTLSSGSLDRRFALAREFKILASLNHPYIIHVLDYGFDECDQPYFTMDLLQNIATIHEVGCEAPIREQVRLLIEVLEALAYLHQCGIIHRDLKPANVVVVDEHVKLLDFGLAIDSNYARTEGISGTLSYIAPEIIRGEAPTTASDLYAVGVMAYEIFTGHHPFVSNTQADLIQQILNATPDIAAIPASFRGLIMWLLAKRPADRPRDALTVIMQLIRALGEMV